MVGSDVTNIALRMVNSDDINGINNYDLQEIVSAAITGANQPATNTMLEQLAGVLGYAFNIQKKVNTNMELLWAHAARMQSYGIPVDYAQLTLVLLANIKRAKNEDHSREFRLSLQNIRRTFLYNNVHDEASLTAILQEFTVGDGICLMRYAPGRIGMG